MNLEGYELSFETITEDENTSEEIQKTAINFTTPKFLSYSSAAFRSLINKLILNRDVREALQNQIVKHKMQACKTVRSIVAQFELDYRYCDYQPILSFLRVFTNDEQYISPLKIPGVSLINGFFFDKNTGWVVKMENRSAIKIARRIYVQYFWNRRAGKRYIFGIKPNGKTVLIAILTHISAPYFEQKHKTTQIAVRQATILAKREVYPIQYSLLEQLVKQVSRIKKKEDIQTLLERFENVNPLRPFLSYINYYALDKIVLNKYWKHPHDKINWLKIILLSLNKPAIWLVV